MWPELLARLVLHHAAVYWRLLVSLYLNEHVKYLTASSQGRLLR
jgi:hypothetical protein